MKASHPTNEIVDQCRRPPLWRKIVIGLAVGLTIVTLGILIAMPPLIMYNMVNRHVDFVEMYEAKDFGIDAAPLTLTTEDDLKLAAWEVACENPRGVVVFTSGIHNPSVTAFFGHAAMLREEGFVSVLVEMRAHGESEGDRIALGMEEVRDVQAAVDYIETKYGATPIVSYGLSMGGATAINATGEIPAIDAVISMSAFSSWTDVFCDTMKTTMGIPCVYVAMQRPFVTFYCGFVYGFSKLSINPLAEIKKLDGRPALLMHSTGDTQVPFKSFERLSAAAPQAETYVVEGDRHSILDDGEFTYPRRDPDFSGAVIGFLDAHFPAAS